MSNTKNCFSSHKVGVRVGFQLSEKTSVLLLCLLFFLFSLYSCSPSKEEMGFHKTSAKIDQSLPDYFAPMVTDTIDGIAHNFVRTAELKCKVKDVLAASEKVEELVKKHRGYTSSSNFKSLSSHNNSIAFKKDSILNLNYYHSTNTLILNVPNKQLDSILNQISKLSVFIDYLKLTTDDVKMQLSANQLSEQRHNAYKKNTKLKLSRGVNKLEHFIKAEETVLEKQSIIDDARISSYELAEKVNYSTLVVEFYQTPQLEYTVLPCEPFVKPFETPFLERLKDSFLSGTEFFASCILLLVKSFGFILFATLLFFIYSKIKPVVFKYFGKIH